MNLKIAQQDIIKIANLPSQRVHAHQIRKSDIVSLIERWISSGSRLLDVGCCIGDTTIELSMRGYKMCGIDYDAPRLMGAEFLSKKYGQDIIFKASSFDDFVANDKLDGIIFGEVLEHFSDPVRVLKKAEGMLRDKGKVILTLPNMPSFRNRLKFFFFGVFPDNYSEHKYYFDYHRLKDVVSKTNFKIESFETRYADLPIKWPRLNIIVSTVLGWFVKLFRKSGDTIFAVLSLK